MSENQQNNESKGSAFKAFLPLLRFLGSLAGKIVIIIVSAAIIFSILGVLLKSNNSVILVLTFLALGYFGWQSLNKMTPDMFLWMPIGSWVIFYIVKGILSIVIGAFVAPFWIGNKISNLIVGSLEEMGQDGRYD